MTRERIYDVPDREQKKILDGISIPCSARKCRQWPAFDLVPDASQAGQL